MTEPHSVEEALEIYRRADERDRVNKRIRAYDEKWARTFGPDIVRVLDKAWEKIQSVPYPVGLRWVFYCLLQDGLYKEKGGYDSLGGLLSWARHQYFKEWRPWSLADESRTLILSGRWGDSKDEEEFLETLNSTLSCSLDKWYTQPVYVEIWFEANAMINQFLYHANRYTPLIPFGGEYTVNPKWQASRRIVEAWRKYHHPIHIYYYGDLDPRGKTIPESAWFDVEAWVYKEAPDCDVYFTRVGVNPSQPEDLGMLENPERPGQYQWEALSDEKAEPLIHVANEFLDMEAFRMIEEEESQITDRLRQGLASLRGED